ncbi:MAG: hypothetical protein Q9218_002893 [Villophora microphyllina]
MVDAGHAWATDKHEEDIQPALKGTGNLSKTLVVVFNVDTTTSLLDTVNNFAPPMEQLCWVRPQLPVQTASMTLVLPISRERLQINANIAALAHQAIAKLTSTHSGDARLHYRISKLLRHAYSDRREEKAIWGGVGEVQRSI